MSSVTSVASDLSANRMRPIHRTAHSPTDRGQLDEDAIFWSARRRGAFGRCLYRAGRRPLSQRSRQAELHRRHAARPARRRRFWTAHAGVKNLGTARGLRHGQGASQGRLLERRKLDREQNETGRLLLARNVAHSLDAKLSLRRRQLRDPLLADHGRRHRVRQPDELYLSTGLGRVDVPRCDRAAKTLDGRPRPFQGHHQHRFLFQRAGGRRRSLARGRSLQQPARQKTKMGRHGAAARRHRGPHRRQPHLRHRGRRLRARDPSTAPARTTRSKPPRSTCARTICNSATNSNPPRPFARTA